MPVLDVDELTSERQREMLVLPSHELVQRLYATIASVSDRLGEDAGDELYLVVDELLERFAPHIEWQHWLWLCGPESEAGRDASMRGRLARHEARLREKAWPIGSPDE